MGRPKLVTLEMFVNDMIDKHFPDGLLYHGGHFYDYSGGVYSELPIDNMNIAAKLFKLRMDNYYERDQSLPKGEALEVGSLVLTAKGLAQIDRKLAQPVDLDSPSSSFAFLNFKNGLLDIKQFVASGTLTLQPHRNSVFTLTQIPHTLKAGPRAPIFLEMLQTIQPDPLMQQLIQEIFGLCLLPGQDFEKAILFLGEGANGKSVILLILRLLLGAQNISSVSLEMMNAVRTFPIASMRGKMANIVEDMAEIDNVSEGVVKQIISGDSITFEKKYGAPITEPLGAKLIFATNVFPRFKDRSDAIWRRLIIVPFKVQILDERLQRKEFKSPQFWIENNEIEGVLLWALEGMRRLCQRGHFIIPDEAGAQLRSLKLDANPARQFLEDHFQAKPGTTVSSKSVHSEYREWAQSSGYLPLAACAFSKEVKRCYPQVELTEHPRHTASGRSRLWVGLERQSTSPYVVQQDTGAPGRTHGTGIS